MEKRNIHGTDSLAPTIAGVAWSLAAVSIPIVVLRFYTRAIVLRRVGLDDWVMLLAMVLMLNNTILVQIAIHYGLGRHIGTLDPADAMMAIKWDYIAQPTSIMAPTFGRISFAIMLLNFAGYQRYRRWILYIIIVLQFVSNSLCFIFILVQCKPIQLLWDKSLDGKCWDLKFQEDFGYYDGSLNSATDLILAVWAAVMVWHLNMKLATKLSLIGLMGLGIFAMAGSIAKTISLSSVGSQQDYTYNTSHLVIWYSVENYLVIIAASIPTLKPLISTRRKGTLASGSAGSYGKNTFLSRRANGYHSTKEPSADNFPLTSTGTDPTNVEATYSQRELRDESYGEGDIRKTVDVSVDYHSGRKSGS